MKKIWTLLMVLCLLVMTGCGAAPAASGSAAQSGSAVASASGSSEDAATVTDGFLGDTMATAFFEFSVDSAESVATYESYTAAEGNQLIVVTMTIHNTDTYSMPMYDDDFQIQWGDGDEDYGFPVAGTLCSDFEIPINGTKSGDLVFEVPTDAKDLSVAFQEFFDDDSEGDSFFVYFTVEPGASVGASSAAAA
jgi:hypothetical protein